MKSTLTMAAVVASAIPLAGQALPPPISEDAVRETCRTLAVISSHGVERRAALGMMLVAEAIREKGYTCEDAFFEKWSQEIEGGGLESIISELPTLPGWRYMPSPESPPNVEPDVSRPPADRPLPGSQPPRGPTGQGPTGQGPTGQGPTGQGPTGQGPTGQGPAGQPPAPRSGCEL